DQLLRAFLARDATLRLYGPAGLADCVEGKLAGYTWNLTEEYPFVIEVTDIGERETTDWRFAARRRFEREMLGPPRPFTGVVLADPVFTVEAVPLDHRIVSMAYAVTERTHLNVRAGALGRAAGVHRLQVFHFSPRYEGRYGDIVAEAQAEFAGREPRYGGLERGSASLP